MTEPAREGRTAGVLTNRGEDKSKIPLYFRQKRGRYVQKKKGGPSKRELRRGAT